MNKIATFVSPNAVNMIRMDHSHVMLAFHKYRLDSAPGVKQALIRQIILALEVHAQLEEEIFYPAVFAAAPDSPVQAKSVPEHDEMRRLAGELRKMDGFDSRLDDTLMELMRGVIHHVADEETLLLPQAERVLGADRLCELGAQMTKRRLSLLGPRAGELATSVVRAAPAKATMIAVGTVLLGLWLIDRTCNDGRRSHQLRKYFP